MCCVVRVARGALRVIAVLAGQGQLQAPAGTVLPQSRGHPEALFECLNVTNQQGINGI